MGIDIAQTRFLDACADRAPITGPTLALGSLTIRETDETIERFAHEQGHSRLAREKTVAALMIERYGVGRYFSCDINGLADLRLDLSRPLPPEHKGVYGSILNGGTLEHIFDIRQAMENIHDAVTLGGLIIHTTPMTWHDHGFYNFNPVFFHQTAEANAYEIVAEGYYFCAGTFDGQDRPFVSLNGVDPLIPHIATTPASLFGARTIPAHVMHLIGLRRTSSAPFMTPVQEAH